MSCIFVVQKKKNKIPLCLINCYLFSILFILFGIMNFRFLFVHSFISFITRTPMIAGGLFSINKTTFEYYGKYDPQMNIWVSIINFIYIIIFILHACFLSLLSFYCHCYIVFCRLNWNIITCNCNKRIKHVDF